MTKITTGLASATLAALALGAITPMAASATPAPTSADGGATTDAPSTSAISAPTISEIVELDDRHVAVNGIAQDATSVLIQVEGGGGGAEQVVQGRFSMRLEREHLGKDATIRATGPAGSTDRIPFVVELKADDGSVVVPEAPDVHAVSQYEPGTIVIEGTVAYDPLVFDRTEVVATVDGAVVRSALDENGGFALPISTRHEGAQIEIRSWRSGLKSDATIFHGVPTPVNYASEAFPLEIASPASDDVVVDQSGVVFAGSAIPNSQIVVTESGDDARTLETLCETRVAADGDWSCTSPTLPAGDYDTTVTETPMWRSAATQTAGTAFSVADAGDAGEGESVAPTPKKPILSSVIREEDGQLTVRVIANGAGQARIDVGEYSHTLERGLHNRFLFTLDASMAGSTATVTGLSGDDESEALDFDLTPVDAPAGSDLAAPLVHGIVEDGSTFSLQGTLPYFDDEYFVPTVIAQIDGEFVGASLANFNGAFALRLDTDLRGEQIDLITVRNSEKSERTTITLEPTDGNDAAEVFPLDVVSPAEGETLAVDATTMVGEGIPGSKITVGTDATGTAKAFATEVLGDGSWAVEIDAPLVAGDHEMTVTETPYWDGVAGSVSNRSFSVTDEDGSDDGEAVERPIAVTSPADGDTFAAGSVVTFTGTATPEATVSVRLGYGLAPLVTEADENGNWTVSRWLGNAPYTANITQSKNGAQIGGTHTGPTITPAG